MSDEDRPEILGMSAEREILISQLGLAIERAWRRRVRPDLVPGEEQAFALSSTAVTAVLMTLPLLSARQLAILLADADEADRKNPRVICEPPHYSADEIENVSPGRA